MSLTRSDTRRFFACLLSNVLFVAVTLLFLKPRDIAFNAEDAVGIIEVLSLGSLFGLVVIYFSSKVNDEAFSRRLAASGLLSMALVGQFKNLDVGHYFGIANPGVSAVLTAWSLIILVNLSLQLLRRLSPSHFR